MRIWLAEVPTVLYSLPLVVHHPSSYDVLIIYGNSPRELTYGLSQALNARHKNFSVLHGCANSFHNRPSSFKCLLPLVATPSQSPNNDDRVVFPADILAHMTQGRPSSLLQIRFILASW